MDDIGFDWYSGSSPVRYNLITCTTFCLYMYIVKCLVESGI